MTIIDTIIILHQLVDTGAIMTQSMGSTTNYIFTDKNFINASQVPYYSNLSPSMMQETQRWTLDHILIMSDYVRILYLVLALVTVTLKKQTIIFTLHNMIIAAAFCFEVGKMVRHSLAMAQCNLYWYCFLPSETPVKTPVAPSTEFVIMFAMSIYFVVSILARISFFYLLKKEVKREAEVVILSQTDSKKRSKKSSDKSRGKGYNKGD